ncbi:unnamed protein product [Mycena citricolor]|uniref:Peptidase M20 dimerisation domain-containing protein n=1 Tax=Mycena citricolor TaxID=2018698 RepID=A0AAD2HE78_9AGAR|nr:unnamed protein product [Mycena citricolor]
MVKIARATIHSRPELSFEEHETADYIAAQLTEAGILFRRIAGTGILARIEGHGDLQRCVVLRADTDALPIWEETGLECASRHDGVMHACGHDMHTACLLGALLVLNRHKSEIAGTVFGLFQPGEEVCPGGASMVMAEDPFRDYRVVAFVGSTSPRNGKVHGTGGHGALPHTMTDPVVAAAALITSLQQVVSRNNNATIPTVLSIGRVIANGATNVIPPVVQVAGTLRTMDERWRAQAKRRIHEIAAGVAAAHCVTAEVKIPEGYPCVVNDPALTVRARSIAAKLWGKEHVEELDLRMTAEDFGTYTERYPSLFFRLGTARKNGECGGALHTATFNRTNKRWITAWSRWPYSPWSFCNNPPNLFVVNLTRI